jgi:hypothetical protein
MHIKNQVKLNKPAVTRASLDQLFYISSAAHPAIVGLGLPQELPRKTETVKKIVVLYSYTRGATRHRGEECKA